jgi:hypothetical protein
MDIHEALCSLIALKSTSIYCQHHMSIVLSRHGERGNSSCFEDGSTMNRGRHEVNWWNTLPSSYYAVNEGERPGEDTLVYFVQSFQILSLLSVYPLDTKFASRLSLQ